MATTAKGIYFPDVNTNVNLLSIFQALASSVDSALGDFTFDSGWIDIPTSELINGWESYNTTGSRTRYRKIGRNVKMDGIARRGTATDMFILPVGYRPVGVYPNYSAAITSTSTTARSARLRVSTAGVVQAYQMTQAERNLGVGLSVISFFTD